MPRKIPDFQDSFPQKRASSGRISFGGHSCIYSRYLPIKIQGGLVRTFLEEVNIVNFFLEIYNFFSTCEIRILIFGVNVSPISVTHQMILYIYTYDVH